jgi:hypothetical protein
MSDVDLVQVGGQMDSDELSVDTGLGGHRDARQFGQPVATLFGQVCSARS